ncbi:hypothetical protein BDW75DRAFT_117802 [Aspergillus navahoensis]
MSSTTLPLLSSTAVSSPSATRSFSSYFDLLSRKRQQKKMSITQTYYLAHTARRKLTREASRADHDLRLLVGHANLLDSLMLDLADAEQEQERWFNQTVSGAAKGAYRSENQHHVQWADSLVEEPEEEDWDPEYLSDDDSDLSGEEDSDLEEDYTPVRRRAPSPVAIVTETELEDYDSDSDLEYDYDDAEDLDGLALTRSPSRQPPELSHDEDDSEDDSMPPSPPQPILESFDEKQAHTEVSLADPDFEHRYYVRPAQSIIEAC